MRTKFSTDCIELQQYCIRNQFFTSGNNVEYSQMFDNFRTINIESDFNGMTKQLEQTAREILNHTPAENYIIDGDFEENVKEVMSNIIEIGAVSIYFD